MKIPVTMASFFLLSTPLEGFHDYPTNTHEGILSTDEQNYQPGSTQDWYYRGLNDYHEGNKLLAQKDKEKSINAFKRASRCFESAFQLLEQKNDPLSLEILLLLTESLYRQQDENALRSAYDLLKNYADIHKETILASHDPVEFELTRAVIAINLYESQGDENHLHEAQSLLMQIQELYPETSSADTTLFYLGTSYYIQRNYQLSEETFMKLVNRFPESPFSGEALYWCGRSAQSLSKPQDSARSYYTRVYSEYPLSKYAADAYFLCYSLQEYLQGGRQELKHLLNFVNLYPESPFVIDALFLIGLDHKRDRKSTEGKWLSKKNLVKAIDFFYRAETTFEAFEAAGTLPPEQVNRYRLIRYRSILERAKANLAIAEESEGAKRQIFLDYAANVFKEIIDSFGGLKSALAKMQDRSDFLAATILEESLYGMADTYRKSEHYDASKETLMKMIQTYDENKVTKGYFLSQSLFSLGEIMAAQKHYDEAIAYFRRAEDSGKGNILSTDQKLNLWIQISDCYRAMNDLDGAMSILSQVINEDAISGLRLKAMYLRAEIYSLQGRIELARKQLEATSKKGGEWAKKAMKTLEEDYGYPKHTS